MVILEAVDCGAFKLYYITLRCVLSILTTQFISAKVDKILEIPL